MFLLLCQLQPETSDSCSTAKPYLHKTPKIFLEYFNMFILAQLHYLLRHAAHRVTPMKVIYVRRWCTPNAIERHIYTTMVVDVLSTV